MNAPRAVAALTGLGLLVGACSSAEEVLWPSPDEPGQEASAVATGDAAPSPQLSTAPAVPNQPTGTVVGQRVSQLRQELARLQASVDNNDQQLSALQNQIKTDSQRYHATVAAINTRLQVGTTPGNPVLVQQHAAARADLDKISGDIGQLNGLVAAVTEDSNLAGYLSESTRATFALSGAVDEDHRQLADLQSEVDKTTLVIERLLNDLSDDVRRQTEYVSAERGNLNLVASGIRTGQLYGPSLFNQALFSSSASSSPMMGAGATPASTVDLANRRPLVVIRFDRPQVEYREALYNAVGRVLEQRPQATFDVIGVTPTNIDPSQAALQTSRSRRYAEGVQRSLIDMGLPPARLGLSSGASQNAITNEVHLYVR
jgi:hypothetical protein